MGRRTVDETRDGVELTNLDTALFADAGATKRDLVEYLDAVAEPLVAALRDRPLSVVRVRPGQPPFMQKNLPAYAPAWIERVEIWSHAARRTVSYPLCQDRRTLLWLANQRAVEFHPTLGRASADGATWEADVLILDLDPPEGAGFDVVVRTAKGVRAALAEAGLFGAVKTSGAKGLHVVVPLAPGVRPEDAAAATRALAARSAAQVPEVATTAYLRADRDGKVFVDATRSVGSSLVAVYSPRCRAGVPVSTPLTWDDLDDVRPAQFTVRTALASPAAHPPGVADPWRSALPAPQLLPPDLVAEGHRIPVARVAAMHEGKRRRRLASGEGQAAGEDQTAGEAPGTDPG